MLPGGFRQAVYQKIKINFHYGCGITLKYVNEWRGQSPQLGAWATQLRKNVTAVASRGRQSPILQTWE